MEYNHIIAPLDGSELAEAVLPHLDLIIKSWKINNIELIRVVHPLEIHYKSVVPLTVEEENTINNDAVREAEKYLNDIKLRLGVESVTTIRVLLGNVNHVLPDYINKSGADLLVIATHGRSGPSLLYWGSVAEKLVRTVCVPTLIVHPPNCIPK